MSKESLNAKLDFILLMCDNINKIIERHNGIVNSLKDFESQMAILMAISQIGETLKKFPDDIVIEYDLKDDKEGAYYTRNYIVHDYEGVDMAFIENIVRSYIPKLKQKILKIKKAKF